MARPLTIFISYTTRTERDKTSAARLRADLMRAGARVFQFEHSAQPGSDAWDQVFRSIDDSDWFFAILSDSAVASKPVQAELKYAFDRHVNGDLRLMPLLVEPFAAKRMPARLRAITPIDLSDYSSALARVLEALGLTATPVPQREVAATPPPQSPERSPRSLEDPPLQGGSSNVRSHVASSSTEGRTDGVTVVEEIRRARQAGPPQRLPPRPTSRTPTPSFEALDLLASALSAAPVLAVGVGASLGVYYQTPKLVAYVAEHSPPDWLMAAPTWIGSHAWLVWTSAAVMALLNVAIAGAALDDAYDWIGYLLRSVLAVLGATFTSLLWGFFCMHAVTAPNLGYFTGGGVLLTGGVAALITFFE